MKNILVVGAKGNMGQRYCRILDLFGHSYLEFDKENDLESLNRMVNVSDGCIIATPTETHCELISTIYHFKPHMKFLVEKPLSKDIEEVELILNPTAYPHMHITLINQYKYMYNDMFHDDDDTYYNYFKTGNDGLAWDCISIIGLARGEVEIRNDSPVWKCVINGYIMDRCDVDTSYVDMLRDWIKSPEPNHDYIIHAHKKVLELKDKIDANCINSNTSKVKQ